jgi:hypothetical protein
MLGRELRVDIEYKCSSDDLKLASEIPDGTVFTGMIGSNLSRIFLKSSGYVIALDEKSAVKWTHDIKIKNYRPRKVKLAVED